MAGQLEFDRWSEAEYRGVRIVRAQRTGEANPTAIFAAATRKSRKNAKVSYYYYLPYGDMPAFDTPEAATAYIDSLKR